MAAGILSLLIKQSLRSLEAERHQQTAMSLSPCLKRIVQYKHRVAATCGVTNFGILVQALP